MPIAQPGIQTTVPGISLAEVPAGTVSTDGTLTGTGATGSPLSVTQSYPLLLGTFAVGALPSAATHKGSLALVTDSSVVLWGTNVVGGGAGFALVFSNGANWTVLAI